MPILKIAEAEISKLKHEIDLINVKLRSKLFPEEKKKEGLEEIATEKPIKDDGLNELRELRKSGVG